MITRYDHDERAASQAGFLPGFVQRGERDGGNGGDIDPVVAALIDKLPKKGPWPLDDRIMWLQMLSMAFQLAYGQDGTIEIKKGCGLSPSHVGQNGTKDGTAAREPTTGESYICPNCGQMYDQLGCYCF